MKGVVFGLAVFAFEVTMLWLLWYPVTELFTIDFVRQDVAWWECATLILFIRAFIPVKIRQGFNDD